MAETVAINKRKQKSFKTSVDNYKKLLKAGKIKIKDVVPEPAKTPLPERGVVFVSNIPHGFYETEMKQYFAQFGRVTRLRLARSKHTGKSKGYAFIEFKEPEVAKIAAETMDKYLMCKRLLKAKYIAPEDQHESYFKGKNWTSSEYPKVLNRKMNIIRNRASKSEKQMIEKTKECLSQITKTKKLLQKVGINYDFKPVDIPANLKKIINKSDKSDKVDSDKSDSDKSDSEKQVSDENVPVLEIDESDESDIVFQVPSGVKKIIKQKTVSPDLSAISTKNISKFNGSKKDKSNLISKTPNKKLSGISKKSKVPKIPMEKESKKFKLIQKNILVNDQVNLKTKDDIKNKKFVGNKIKNAMSQNSMKGKKNIK